MSETTQDIAIEMVAHEREHLTTSASLLQRRLALLAEHGGEGMGHDFPTILSLLARMRDAIELYRRAIAVEEAVSTALATPPQPVAGGWVSRDEAESIMLVTMDSATSTEGD